MPAPATREEAAGILLAAHARLRASAADSEHARTAFQDAVAAASACMSFRAMSNLVGLDPAHLHRTARKSAHYPPPSPGT